MASSWTPESKDLPLIPNSRSRPNLSSGRRESYSITVFCLSFCSALGSFS
jgi:hypothetical protein